MNAHKITLDTIKYKAIAHGRTDGVKLSHLVEERWSDWVEKIDSEPWLRNWKHSRYFDAPGLTPLGKEYVGPIGHFDTSSIALTIYATAVWGFGLGSWGSDYRKAAHKLQELQGLTVLVNYRTYLYSNEYEGSLPLEYAALDMWLSSLWSEI